MKARFSTFRSLLAVALVGSAFLVGACTETNECNDGVDNDGDGRIDNGDPGCLDGSSAESPDPELPECSDLSDNDSDGLIDLDDPDCDSPNDDNETNMPISACQDGIDNDGDGLIDFPNDPGCDLTLKDSEEDDCPDGANCAACGNGIDDDNDGLTDYPDDPGCNSAGDADEFNADPSICGAAVLIQPLPSDGVIMGQIDNSGPNQLISPVCGGSGEEHVYVYDTPIPQLLFISTDFEETTMDTVISLRSDCADDDTELGCNDDNGSSASFLEVERVDAGTYYIIVDANSSAASGDYKLEVQSFTPEKEDCNPAASTCAPGLVCRLFNAQASQETCEKPECSDGQDLDGDTFADFPNDPGCDSPEDNDESDDCPDGPNCPVCSNGQDDDNDTFVDFPDDVGCTSASDNVELDECITGITVDELPDSGVTGTTPATADQPSAFDHSCDDFTGPEDVYAYRNDRNLASLTFSLAGSAGDVMVAVRETDCGLADAEVSCSSGETTTVDAPTQGGTYFVFVDAPFSFDDEQDYVLNVSGEISEGESCVQGDSQFTCEFGTTCGSSDTCEPNQCNDGMDNDTDGLTDFPNDPGCTSIGDNDETDDCPGGANCPECGNESDDDGDGIIDFPDDPGCTSASDDLELDCDDSDPIVSITLPTTTGSTVNATNDFVSTCQTSSTSPDIVHQISFPGAMETVAFDTDGSDYDTVLYVHEGICSLDSSTEIGCDDDADTNNAVNPPVPDLGFQSFVGFENLPAGDYFVVVDGFSSSSSGDYVLNVVGVVASGEACDADQIAAGIVTCATGTTCTAGTCQ